MDVERTLVVGLGPSPSAATVLSFARRLAAALGAALEVVHAGAAAPATLAATVAQAGLKLDVVPGDPVTVLADRLLLPEVVMTVVGCPGEAGGDRPAGQVSLGLLRRASAPVVVVPPVTAVADRPLRHVLLPLDGSRVTAAAADPAVTLLSGAGLHVTAVHVFDAETVPAFLDQAHHGLDVWGREFVARHAEDDVDLVLRAGTPGAELLDVITDVDADLVVLAWSQDLTPGRAATIRRLLVATPVPLLVVPVDGQTATTPPVRRDHATGSHPDQPDGSVGSAA